MSDSNRRRSRSTTGRQSGKGRTAYPASSSSAREEKATSQDGSVRLNKYVADHGVASRRACDELIQAGKVMVDGEPVTRLGTKILPHEQRVEIDGYILRPENAQRRYYLLNKPAGVLCTNERRETRPRAIDLITAREKGRIYTVGRLDEESKGLILLTNDGEFSQRVAHPRYGVPKTYSVKIRGEISEDAVQKIREGVHLSEGRTGGARIIVRRRGRDYSSLDVTLLEGMNREVRRVFARVGHKVIDLKRISIGPLTVRGLRIGSWRALTRAEVESLLAGETGPEQLPSEERAKTDDSTHGTPARVRSSQGRGRTYGHMTRADRTGRPGRSRGPSRSGQPGGKRLGRGQ
ncbi:MAG: 23S rRNA pseudouridine2605 synthase [Chlamydiales bacterium]|jgi:23S rRNA pseudouridine2605 synthase